MARRAAQRAGDAPVLLRERIRSVSVGHPQPAPVGRRRSCALAQLFRRRPHLPARSRKGVPRDLRADGQARPDTPARSCRRAGKPPRPLAGTRTSSGQRGGDVRWCASVDLGFTRIATPARRPVDGRGVDCSTPPPLAVEWRIPARRRARSSSSRLPPPRTDAARVGAARSAGAAAAETMSKPKPLPAGGQDARFPPPSLIAGQGREAGSAARTRARAATMSRR